jgi:hypothetical protein
LNGFEKYGFFEKHSVFVWFFLTPTLSKGEGDTINKEYLRFLARKLKRITWICSLKTGRFGGLTAERLIKT